MMSRELDPTSAAFSLVSTWDGWVWWASPPFFLFLSFLFSLFKFFIDFFCLFHIMYPTSTHLPVSLYLPLQPAHKKETNKKANKQTIHLALEMQCVTIFCSNIFTYKCSL